MSNDDQMKRSTGFLMLLIIGIGTALRLTGLGSAFLTLNEAENALAALHLFDGSSHGQLLYTLPTALLFKMFGDSDFTARLFPALMGIVLSLVPLTFRGRFGSKKMLILAFLLAVDPVLLFWSKRADALLPAIAFTSAALAFFLNHKHAAGLTCFLLALCGGESALPALLITAVCGVLIAACRKEGIRQHLTGKFSKRDILSPGLVFLMVITLLTAFPAGIASFGTGIVNAFQPAPDWAFPGAAAMIAAVLLYCGISLLLFGRKCLHSHQMSVLGIITAGIILLLLWRGMQAIPWISALLWTCALDMIAAMTERLQGEKGFPFYLTAGAVVGAYSFFYFRLVEMVNQQNGFEAVQVSWNGSLQTLPLTRFGASILLTAASILIIGLIVKILLGFFDSMVVRRGIIAGCLVIISWGMLTFIWNTGGFDRIGDHPLSKHSKNTQLLLNGDYTGFTDTPLFDLIEEMILKHGDRSAAEFGVNLISDDPLLEWQLRKADGIRSTNNIPVDLSNVDLILSSMDNSFESGGFVGTVMKYEQKTRWSGYNIQDWGKWLLFGDGKSGGEMSLILWAKGDLVYSSGN